MFKATPPRNRLTLADTPNAIGLARLHTTDVLSRWGVHPDSVETAKLLVSELATNVVQHPNNLSRQDSSQARQSTAQTFEIALEMVDDIVRLSVWDRDAKPPAMSPAGLDATGGRGLLLVDAMSLRWGHYEVPRRPGKVVWADIPVSPVAHGRSENEAHGSAVDRTGQTVAFLETP
ncbi:ATP-binding protein [Streptomyces sp. NPDC046203]|uniref:ATP-binding protein n=1 Tax=Streptomyces sp. NPDC046203 TaxID=3154602 RepID=UPI0033EE9D8B